MDALTPGSLRSGGNALICFSHLRWNFVYQRPQHLLSRFAKSSTVFYFEEPVFGAAVPTLQVTDTDSGVQVVVPHLPAGETPQAAESRIRQLLDGFLDEHRFSETILWYYTPMALGFSDHLSADYCVYDCMDELSAFKFAPPALVAREKQLIERADIMFTGGQSLFEAKRHAHRNIHCFPSSIDKDHFAAARALRSRAEPADQAAIARPRAGFFGVIDERMDLELVAGLAQAAPELQIVMIGPLAKIAASDLPQAANLHWLGPKQYSELPAYLAGWDCGIMPFALNDSTRFISPTKTPEYLAAGLPLVSTGITDVIRPYGELGLVAIAASQGEFTAAVRRSLGRRDDAERLARADGFLADKSWDRTFSQMQALIRQGMSVGSTSSDLPTANVSAS